MLKLRDILKPKDAVQFRLKKRDGTVVEALYVDDKEEVRTEKPQEKPDDEADQGR